MRLGRYRLVEPIGRGGMGVVWSARLDDGAFVAIKVLTSARARDARFLSSFRREARAIARLDHPGIVGVHDLGEVGAEEGNAEVPPGSPYLVMDLVRGVSLHHHRGQLRWRELREILLALLQALAHAHSRGVVHGDLKPSNVLREGRGVQLTDFGVARAADPGGWAPEEVPLGGTPSYMAPELLTSQWRDVGPWTDLYGLGCLAWALAAGRPPFARKNRLETIAAQLTDDLPRFEPAVTVPKGFVTWLQRLLHKRPDARYQRAADAAWALLALPADVTEPARRKQVPLVMGDGPRTTTVFWTDAELPRLPKLPRTPSMAPDRWQGPRPTTGGAPARAPMPSSWRSLPPLGGIVRRLAGTGLGLVGVRPVPVVGREAERDVLWTALRTATGGVAQAVVLTGPAGLGQGRLARWLAERAHEVGAAELVVAHGAPSSAGTVPPMLERALVAHDLDRDALTARLARIAPDLGKGDRSSLVEMLRPSLLGGLLRFAGEAAQRALATRWLRHLAGGRVLVLWIDEAAHAVDALELACHILERRPELPLLAVVSTNDDALRERPEEQALVDALGAHPRGQTCRLGPLPEHQMEQLVREVLGLEPGLAHVLVEKAGGNPRYAVEALREAVSEGRLLPTDQGYRLDEGQQLGLPTDVRAVWSGAVSRALGGGASREVAEIGAVLGQQVLLAEWRRACRAAGLPDPVPVAEALVRARLMEPEMGWYRFVHSLVREALLTSAEEAGRLPDQHRVAAEVLRGSVRGRPRRLGAHLVGCGAYAEGAELLLRGARRAQLTSEYRVARRLLHERELALDALGIADDAPERLEGWVERARAFADGGHPHRAMEWLRRVRDAGGDPGALEGSVALGMGDYDAAEEAFRAHVVEEPIDALLGLAALASERGGDGALALADQACAVAGERGDRLGMARAVSQRATALLGRGDWQRALLDLDEAIDRFRFLGHRRGLARVTLQEGMALRLAGDGLGSEAAFRRALELFIEVGDPVGELRCRNGLGEVARDAADYNGAERHYRQSIELARSIDSEPLELVPTVNLALVLVEQGRVEAARDVFAEVARRLASQDRRALLGTVQIIRAAVAAMCGQQAHAAQLLAEGDELVTATGRVEPDTVTWAERAAEHLADPKVAQRALDFAARQRARMGVPA